MSVIDLSSKPLRVQIAFGDGTSLLDVTPLLLSFSTQDDENYSSGWIKTTGKLTLHANPLEPFAESTSPRTNPGRWARGNRVIIDYDNGDGTFTRHERGRLRILKTPATPHADRQTLDIEVGCLASLQDFRQPPDDSSGVTLGQFRDRRDIIDSLAAKAGIPSLFDALFEYPINFPITTQGSYVETMGKLAWDCGYYLWIDNLERLRAAKIPLRPTSAIATITVGIDEAAFEPIEAAEPPCELIRATGTLTQVSESGDPAPQITVASDDEFDPASITVTSFSGTATTSPSIRTRRKEARGRVFPVEWPGKAGLIVASDERKIRYYSEEEDGILLREYTRVRQPRGVVFPAEYPGVSELVTFQEIYTDYYYENEVTVRIETEVFEPAQLVRAPSQSGSRWSGDALAETRSILWRKTNRGWAKTEVTRNLRAGGRSTSQTGYSGSGNNQPPAPEYREESHYSEEKPISGEARFLPAAGALYREREREYEMFAPVSAGHCQEFALLEGTLLHAQQMGVMWAIARSSEFAANYAPIRPIDITEGSTTRRYLTVGVAFTHEARRCVIAGDGLHLGVVSSGNLTPPFRIAVSLRIEIRTRLTIPLGQVPPDGPQIVDPISISIATQITAPLSQEEGGAIVEMAGAIAAESSLIADMETGGIAELEAAIFAYSFMDGTLTTDIVELSTPPAGISANGDMTGTGGVGSFPDMVVLHGGYTMSQSTTNGALAATFANMTDDDNTTGGATNSGASQWIAATFPVAVSIRGVVIAGGNLSGLGGVAANLNGKALQSSSNGSTWSNVVSSISGVNDSGERVLTFSPRSVRFWRITGTGPIATTEFKFIK